MTDYRQIRALYDKDTITVYQAYNREIAEAAVNQQKLSASPLFRHARMSWIKPSFCWMMYRCGYSYKDKNQERVLAIRMKHEHFEQLLSQSCLAKEEHTRGSTVIVQWDPERGPRLERYNYRSIQIGISGSVSQKWTDEWIVGIEDITEKARSLKMRIDDNQEISKEELIVEGLIPVERPYEMPREINQRLRIGQDQKTEPA